MKQKEKIVMKGLSYKEMAVMIRLAKTTTTAHADVRTRFLVHI